MYTSVWGSLYVRYATVHRRLIMNVSLKSLSLVDQWNVGHLGGIEMCSM